jgi:hypothetical protein
MPRRLRPRRMSPHSGRVRCREVGTRSLQLECGGCQDGQLE